MRSSNCFKLEASELNHVSCSFLIGPALFGSSLVLSLLFFFCFVSCSNYARPVLSRLVLLFLVWSRALSFSPVLLIPYRSFSFCPDLLMSVSHFVVRSHSFSFRPVLSRIVLLFIILSRSFSFSLFPSRFTLFCLGLSPCAPFFFSKFYVYLLHFL